MAAVNIATQIPANINSIERLAAWAMLVNKVIYPDVTYNEDPSVSVKVVQAGIIEAGDKTVRLLVRGAFQLNPDYITSSDPLWQAVQEINQAQIPAAYLRQ